MTTTIQQGRFGNQVIRNLAVSRIAEKHDLHVNYCSHEQIRELGIPLFSGTKCHAQTRILNDSNYFSILNLPQISFNLYPNNDFFQTKDITNFLYTYLHSDPVKAQVIEANPFKERYGTQNDAVLHVRLTDAAGWNPGVNYYLRALRDISCAQIYICTDDPKHSIIQTIVQHYPSAQLLLDTEVRTFQFASTCRHIILSHGSFSAVIGYLAFQSDVYYPEYNPKKMWYGDMFSIPGWHKIPSASWST